ncbi:Aldehyde dehydrogenase [Planococcus halocryophilus Or1]|uniref:Aldehyde dehydrogenase n=1 Tax=Planococcus halocryophilus TaxID=1215089 RepID=A0A1C7DUX9_9BACL|nr:aldehyde dehydrogenase family protein [Planococcus halocryophilus]ANU15265.1 aldehyde dehydrogenase [Planococcus halocryophilus]EMF47615.1 Aldehyde dehydrogenase [Planococcus halocryophilus Or1]
MKKNLYIDKQWVETTDYVELFSPYSNEKIGDIPKASKRDVEHAIDAAANASEEMANLTAYQRAEILEQLVLLFIEHRERAAKLISLESAKPLKYALGEVDRTIETYKFAAEEAKRLTGEMVPMDAAKGGSNRLAYTLREPVGVVAAITPFNFPQNLVAHKIGPAIASGNTMVLKPASQTPLSAFLLAELLDQTDLPKGAFNLVTGSGKTVGDVLVESEKVKMVTFTGSPAVGKGIRDKAGLKKVALELGSNSGLIIDEGVDMDTVIEKVVIGSFSNQGQVCISLQRIYIMESLIEEFLTRFKEATTKLKVGDPLDPATEISAMISKEEQQRAEMWVQEAVAEGAQLVIGGKVEDGVFQPTILTQVSADSKVSCQEVFAPVVIVNPIQSVEQGISEINNSDYGLQAAIFTNDIKTAFNASKKLQVGGVLINDIPTFRVDQMPYGGVKESGNGKEGLKYTIEEMTEMKLVIWNQS